MVVFCCGTSDRWNEDRGVDLSHRARLVLGIPITFASLSGLEIQVLTLHITNEQRIRGLVHVDQILKGETHDFFEEDFQSECHRYPSCYSFLCQFPGSR
jgi:hypothetical protein